MKTHEGESERVYRIYPRDFWVLPESKTSKESAERIEELAKKALSEKPTATAVEREEWEEKLGLPWTHAYETPRVRVVTTRSDSEAKDAAEIVHVMQEFLQGTIGGSTPAARRAG